MIHALRMERDKDILEMLDIFRFAHLRRVRLREIKVYYNRYGFRFAHPCRVRPIERKAKENPEVF